MAAQLEILTPELIFREYAPRIYNLARRVVGSDTDAEDVSQDVLLQVIRKLDTFRGDANILTWLNRITVNVALAYRQKRANRQKYECMNARSDLTWNLPDVLVSASENMAIIEQAINELPELFRDVYLLVDVKGLLNEEASKMLGLSVSAVKSRLHRARMKMRDLLSPHFSVC